MLKELDLFRGNINKVEMAISRLRQFEPPEGYYLAFSGGKDSITLKRLADLATIRYDAHYNNPTIDPPELVKFIRSQYPDVTFDQPPIPFLKRLETRGFPLRQRRWCCQEYKERGGSGRIVLTGIRWAESNRRKKRKLVETCFRDTTKRYVNPIIDWTNDDVWTFIDREHLPYCLLYDEGWKRIGCLFCPMTYKKQRLAEATRYPKYAAAFRKSFKRLFQYKKEQGHAVDSWRNGDEMFEWWISGDQKKQNPDQMVMFE